MKMVRCVLLAVTACATCAGAESCDWEPGDNLISLEPGLSPPRIERTELDRDLAEFEIKAREPSP